MSPTLGEGDRHLLPAAGRTKAGTAIEVEIRGVAVPVEVARTRFYTQGSLKRSA